MGKKQVLIETIKAIDKAEKYRNMLEIQLGVCNCGNVFFGIDNIVGALFEDGFSVWMEEHCHKRLWDIIFNYVPRDYDCRRDLFEDGFLDGKAKRSAKDRAEEIIACYKEFKKLNVKAE